MKKSNQKYIRVILVCTILFVSINYLGKIVTPKDTVEFETWNDFYKLENNSLDVIFIGSSNVFTGISPMKIYQETDIKSWDLASATQRSWISFYYLQEALKTQTPKVVVVDMLGWIYNTPSESEAHARRNLDYTKFSIDKILAIKNTGSSCSEYLSFLFPILRYHTMYEEWFTSDKTTENDSTYFMSGQQILKNSKTITFSNEDNLDVYKTYNKNIEYYDKIIELCNEKGIQCVFIKTPNTIWSKSISTSVENYARDKGVPYINFNYKIDEIGINTSEDFLNEGHLNASGAEKLSGWLAEYLTEYYTELEVNTDADNAWWNQQIEEYEMLMYSEDK